MPEIPSIGPKLPEQGTPVAPNVPKMDPDRKQAPQPKRTLNPKPAVPEQPDEGVEPTEKEIITYRPKPGGGAEKIVTPAPPPPPKK